MLLNLHKYIVIYLGQFLPNNVMFDKINTLVCSATLRMVLIVYLPVMTYINVVRVIDVLCYKLRL